MQKGYPSVPTEFDTRIQTEGVAYEPDDNSLHSARRPRLTLCLERLTVIPERILFVNLGGRGLNGKIPLIGRVPQLRNLKHRNRERKTNPRTPGQLEARLREPARDPANKIPKSNTST